MDKTYILDIKNDNSNNFVLKIGNIKNLKNIDLDVDKSVERCKKALTDNNLSEVHDILDILNQLTEYGDKRFSDLNILYKLREIILFHENMDKKDIIDSMKILLLIKKFFRFLNSQITFRYNDENTHLINKVKEIRENITFKNLLKDNEYRKRNISIVDFETIFEFKKNFINDEEYYFIEEMYEFFKNQIYRQIKRAVLERSIESYMKILASKYEEGYYRSQEFGNLVKKNNLTNYKNFIETFDNNYLLYKFNTEDSSVNKINILMEILMVNFVNLPNIYRSFVIENIINNKKKHLDISNLFNDVDKNLEQIKRNKSLNAIMI